MSRATCDRIGHTWLTPRRTLGWIVKQCVRCGDKRFARAPTNGAAPRWRAGAPSPAARKKVAIAQLVAACRAASRVAWEIGCESEDGVMTLLEDGRGDLYRQLTAALEAAEKEGWT